VAFVFLDRFQQPGSKHDAKLIFIRPIKVALGKLFAQLHNVAKKRRMLLQRRSTYVSGGLSSTTLLLVILVGISPSSVVTITYSINYVPPFASSSQPVHTM
jgi:hypothetical protein